VYQPHVDLLARLAADTTASARASAAVDGREPLGVVCPSSRQEVADIVAAAEEAGAAIVPLGNGTHAHLGMPPARYDLALRTTGLARLVEHDPADMTVTVEAGLTLAALQQALRPAGQWLPLDPPLPESVTIGGLLAADLNGGLRLAHGKARDYLIGVRAVIGGGALVRGGGQVVKNVAGYDLPKVLIGSFGTLGVIVEATFKVRPAPPVDVVLAAVCDSLEQALERARTVLDGPFAPWSLDLCDARAAAAVGLPSRPHVVLRLAGEPGEVAAQRDRLPALLPQAEEIAGATSDALRDFAAGGGLCARLSLLPTDLALLPSIAREAERFGLAVAILAHAGNGIARLRLEGEGDALAFLRWLRSLARQRRGHLILERLPLAMKAQIDAWGEPPSPPELLRRVKAALDPKGTFAPGRMGQR